MEGDMLIKSKVSSEEELITPGKAEEWLGHNTHNRPLHNSLVAKYADEMKRKQWILNGEAIIFDYNGTLLDGQHRLWACIEANTSFQTVVTRGVSPEAFVTIDTGSKRSSGDVLAIAGVSKDIAKSLGAAAVVCISYQRGILKSHGAALKSKSSVSRTDILAYVNRHPKLADWLIRAKQPTARWKSAYCSLIASVMFLGSAKYPEQAEEFMHGWLTGENLGSKSPVLALINRLATEKNLGKVIRLGLITHAWNSFVEKKPLQILKFSRHQELIIKGTEFTKGGK
jgi:hypothetical protein